jgi:hypothetical protein
MKNLCLIITFILISCTKYSYGQIVGSWTTVDINVFTHVKDSKANPDSVTITLKKNGRYRVDIYAKDIFSIQKQPLKGYYFGRWKLSQDSDSLIFYSNYEKLVYKEERQDFKFLITTVDKNKLELVGSGQKKLDYYGNSEPYEIGVRFEETPEFKLILMKNNLPQKHQ